MQVDGGSRLRDALRMPSQRVQVAIVVGLAIILAILDWVINDSFRLAISVGAGAVVGLVILVVNRGRRRRSDL